MNTSVLLISDTVYDSNGVSRFIQDMAAQARLHGYRFSVLSASPLAGTLCEENIVNVKPVRCVKMPYYKEQYLAILPPWLKMYRYIKAAAPDVIHISTPGPLGLTALLIAKRLGIPVAGTYHTDFPAYIRKQTGSALAEKITRWSMTLFYGRMHKVFSRSQKFLPLLHSELGLPESKLVFLPPGTDTAKFNAKHKTAQIWQTFGVPAETLKLLYVGRLSAEKNFMFVIELFEALQQQTAIPLSLVVAGEGVLANEVHARGNANIHLLGVQRGENLSRLYAASDIMLFASVTETLGQVVMEAQASGVPCLVSDRGGVTDIVEHGSTGYCLCVDGHADWAQRALELIKDGEKRRQMGEAASVQMQSRSIETTFKKFMSIHDAIAKGE